MLAETQECLVYVLIGPSSILQAHLVEEEILSRATGFAADEVLRLPPRLPGQGLHQSLIDAAKAQDEAATRAEAREAKISRRRDREAAHAAAVAVAADSAGDTTGDNGQEGAGARGRGSSGGGGKPANSRASTAGEATAVAAAALGDGGAAGEDAGELSEEDDEYGENGTSNEIDGGEAAVAAAAAYGDETWLESKEEVLERTGGAGSGAVPEWDRVPTAREEGRAHDVVVTGPPLSGKSTLSRALAARYGLPALTMDGTVKAALRLRNKLGARVRAAVHWFTAKEQACVLFSKVLVRFGTGVTLSQTVEHTRNHGRTKPSAFLSYPLTTCLAGSLDPRRGGRQGESCSRGSGTHPHA